MSFKLVIKSLNFCEEMERCDVYVVMTVSTIPPQESDALRRRIEITLVLTKHLAYASLYGWKTDLPCAMPGGPISPGSEKYLACPVLPCACAFA